MACLVSLCSFTHFTSHKTLIQDLQERCPNSCRLLLSSSTCLTGIHFVALKTYGEELRSMKRCHLRRYCGDDVLLDYKLVRSSSPRVISGFWVGPDVAEDGWGFVEAVVNQISDFDYF
ncbi:hypothetical protein OSB04_016944 [Centaurea solstitialis]|uniref:Uncharacterized protein n=1 Tax=Centaurea solstitialis TaxID=347529 RepID=A0AA38T1Z6_9ASTR|nr:hypothetical protein OSB04_016944 [Centaurea solstitialis]